MGKDQSSEEDSTSTESVNPDLGSKDIKFLKAVQEVNARNGYEPRADDRPPATTSKIADAADLTKNEVNYRLNQRGFDTDGLGYITVYGAKLLENGALSSKSAELTGEGEAALQDVLEGGPSGSGVPDGDIEEQLSELSEGISELRKESQALRDAVQRIENSETGAWSVDREEQFEATLNAMVAYQRIFNDVLGIDVSEFPGTGEIPDETILEARQSLRETVIE